MPTSYKGITIRNWYASQNLEMPEYYEPIQDTDLSDYFMEIYVFRGEFTAPLYEREMNEDGTTVKTYVGPLSKYLATDGNSCMIDMNYKNSFGEDDDALEAMSTDSNSHFVGSYSGITLPNFKDANGNYISIDLKFNGDNNLHKMIMELNESVLDEKYDPEDIENAKSSLIECLSVDSISADTDPEFEADSKLRPIYLPGYVYKTIEKTAGADDIYRSCMAQLSTKGIRTALTNRVDVEYHYIVDTFDTPVVPEFAMGYKKELIGIAKEKDNAFAILNFPKMTEFTSNSACKSEVTGVFDIEKITEVFSLPSEVEGASYGAYYTQLMFSDGTVKSVIPSAALVSNLFMEKWGPRQPYYIVAGPNYGRISYSGLVGPDYNFGRSDLDVLEPMGVNAIIYVPRKGTYINSNQTAKQAPVSGLSKVHIRELVIYLQNEIEYLLQSYQWELNTQALRDLIKAKADVICETIKNNGGLYAYINVCDETNNTPEIIDNEMIVLNTEIEPARGAGKMVHQLTIHKTGALSSKIQ